MGGGIFLARHMLHQSVNHPDLDLWIFAEEVSQLFRHNCSLVFFFLTCLDRRETMMGVEWRGKKTSACEILSLPFGSVLAGVVVMCVIPIGLIGEQWKKTAGWAVVEGKNRYKRTIWLTQGSVNDKMVVWNCYTLYRFPPLKTKHASPKKSP